MPNAIEELKDEINELNRQLEILVYDELEDVYALVAAQLAIGTTNNLNKIIGGKTPQINETTKRIINCISDNKGSFIKWVNERCQGLYNKCEVEVRKHNPDRTNAIINLSAFLEFLNLEESDITFDFEELSKMLNYINFNPGYQIRLIANIIKTNAELDEFPESKVFIPDIPKLVEYNYQYITRDEVLEILKNRALEEFFKEENPKNPEAQRELRNRFDETKIDYTNRRNTCHNLYNIFSKKISDLTEEDYQKIVDNMDNILFGHLSYRLIRTIKKSNEQDKSFFEILKRKEEKINNAEDNSEEPIKEETVKEEPKKVNKEKLRVEKIATSKGSNKVYKKPTNINQAKREINKYFDLDSLELRDLISLSDAIYCLSLMYSIEETNETIEVFLREINREYKKLNPFAFYYCLYEKLEYLSEKDEEVKEYLDMIEYILSEGNLFMCTDEKYEEMKKLIQPEVESITKAINGNYSYEEKKAKALLKTNEE